MTKNVDWLKELAAAITVCDREGKIVAMNDRAAAVFAAEGGRELLGKSLFDCHPEKAQRKLRELFADRRTNCYTIEKGNVKKLIYQTPWYEGGRFSGYVELSLEIPFVMPHFIRPVS